MHSFPFCLSNAQICLNSYEKKNTLASKTNMEKNAYKMISLAPIMIKRRTKLILTSNFVEYFGVVVQHLLEIENG